MSLLKKFSLLAVLLAAGAPAFAGEGVVPMAEPLFKVGPLPVTNSMVTSWAVAIVLIVLIRLMVKKPQIVPTKGQALVESIVQGILDVTEPIVGKKVAIPTFWLLAGLFIFILTENWSSLFPGVGTVKMLDAHGQWMDFVRPGNADLNGTIALALVSFFAWLYYIIRYAGPGAILFDIFGNKANKRDVPAVLYYILFPVFFGVGLIEIISIMFRPVSLSLRLYGNIFGGESLLHAMSGLCKWGLPIPFYFLELLVGFVQALVFMLLVAIYIGLICNHGDDHGHEPAGKDAAHSH